MRAHTFAPFNVVFGLADGFGFQIWMSLGATAALLLVALNAAGGHCCGYMGRRTHRAAYNY